MFILLFLLQLLPTFSIEFVSYCLLRHLRHGPKMARPTSPLLPKPAWSHAFVMVWDGLGGSVKRENRVPDTPGRIVAEAMAAPSWPVLMARS